MRRLIDEDPKVRKHFDTDGNGVIDGDEWEQVRQLVVRRLERQDEEAAESARMQAEYERELAEDPAASEQPQSASIEDRDFSKLELAFDPRAEQAAGSVAEEIYRQDLPRRVAPHVVRMGEDHTLGAYDELILEQQGGVKQLFGSMFRREYDVKTGDGEVVGHVVQRQNEMLQNMSSVSVFDLPEIEFHVEDYVASETFVFKRNRGLTDNSIMVLNPRGMMIATTSWTLSFVRRKYEVRIVREKMSYYVRRRMLRPWTYEVLDSFEDPIGEMQRGWSGFGFLSGANLFRIVFDELVSADAMWGFLATALLADLDQEPSSRRSFLDPG